jgi:hypothetical protein
MSDMIVPSTDEAKKHWPIWVVEMNDQARSELEDWKTRAGSATGPNPAACSIDIRGRS